MTVLVILFLGLGAVDLWWHHNTGTWFPSLSATPQGMATSGTKLAPLPVSPSPLVPQQPAAAPSPSVVTNPVTLGVPTLLKVYRGTEVIIPPATVGQYSVVNGVDPPGNNPVWLNNVGSKVGVGMGTAWIAGHTELANAAMPFNNLGSVQPGDLVDLTVDGQTVTFQIDSVGPPPSLPDHPGEIQITNDPNTVKLVSCTPAGDANIVASGHAISL